MKTEALTLAALELAKNIVTGCVEELQGGNHMEAAAFLAEKEAEFAATMAEHSSVIAAIVGELAIPEHSAEHAELHDLVALGTGESIVDGVRGLIDRERIAVRAVEALIGCWDVAALGEDSVAYRAVEAHRRAQGIG